MTAQRRRALLTSLPDQHLDYLFKRVQEVCKRFETKDISEFELFSEIWCWVAATNNDETDNEVSHRDLLISDTPSKDGRVDWLIRDLTSKRNIRWRCEDIRRRRFGRLITRETVTDGTDVTVTDVPGSYRTVQASDTDSGDSDELEDSTDDDLTLAGLFRLIETEFSPEDKVYLLIQLLRSQPLLWDEFTSEKKGRGENLKWPRKELAAAGNASFPNQGWTEQSVDAAKNRLRNFLKKEMRKRGLTDVQFKTFLAKLGRDAAAIN